MLLAAAKQYNIDLAASWMAGDAARDIGAGKAAGCKTALVGGAVEAVTPDLVCGSLGEFVEKLLAGTA
jgi:D-glycero-D-manno-heptose 1,7-bisphosphate phosphatase